MLKQSDENSSSNSKNKFLSYLFAFVIFILLVYLGLFRPVYWLHVTREVVNDTTKFPSYAVPRVPQNGKHISYAKFGTHFYFQCQIDEADAIKFANSNNWNMNNIVNEIEIKVPDYNSFTNNPKAIENQNTFQVQTITSGYFFINENETRCYCAYDLESNFLYIFFIM